ncbi:histone-like nucleoid-structuring protein Lsr2 [Microcella sp.]|uniref:histone-like nucleoid-structuring protein Lsr2 n=1 Tax=Microcella sp. TaxID=1913979 RepID=UPI00391C7DB0
MAHKIVLVDDLDGTELGDNAVTTRFSLNGAHYEIDLNESNRQKLADALAPFIAAGRRASAGVAAGRASGAKKRGGASKSNTSAIREWANANGHPVGDRGRIPAHIVDAYEAATGK